METEKLLRKHVDVNQSMLGVECKYLNLGGFLFLLIQLLDFKIRTRFVNVARATARATGRKILRMNLRIILNELKTRLMLNITKEKLKKLFLLTT